MLDGRVYTITKETVKGTSEGVAAYARGQGESLAEEGSAWVIVERAGIGLAKGGARSASTTPPARSWTPPGASRAGRCRTFPTLGRRRSRASCETWPRAPPRAPPDEPSGIAVGKRWAAEKVTPR